MSMAEYGLLIDMEWCTGCHTCEIACQTEHGMAPGQTGIKIFEVGPWEISEGAWQFSYIPTPTDQCDLCATRRAGGKDLPSGVKHCQAQCMAFGRLEDLQVKLGEKPKQVLFSVR